MRRRSLVNILANNPLGSIFLEAVDALDVVKDVDMLFKHLDDLVEEVGEELAVQVVTDNASRCLRRLASYLNIKMHC